MVVHMLVFFAFVAAFKFSFAGKPPRPTFSSVKEWENSNDSYKFVIVKDYVHYALYFQESCRKENCEVEEFNNKTSALFSAAIDTCSLPRYSTRVLASTQVSLKRHDDRSNDVKHNETESFDSSTGANTSTSETAADDKGNIVHEYLAIALVLPRHPFSRALINAMPVVSSMFPFVTSYLGVATEFQSLSNQYGVRSYPSLLLFHKGLLVDKISNVNGEAYKPAQLAKRISKWTNKLPRSCPVAPPVQKKLTNSNRGKDRHPIFELQNITALSRVVVDWISNVDMSLRWSPLNNDTSAATEGGMRHTVANFGESIEPLVSMSADPRAIDVPVYLLAAAYVFLRSVFWVKDIVCG